ncbi:hypothetical protein [Aquimarina pacifica]|uniref:hypothetical protein n=1 Tax=Aquimarina pacifica TaxID=1296415 RepID=UPI00046EA80B|nr:hypothetical protein [Aquimarina pacifica]
MSKTVAFFIFILIGNLVFSQKNEEAVFFTQKAQIGKFYSINDLEAMKKGELIKLYQDRVAEILAVLPFLSLTNEAGVQLADIGIKEDSRHLKVLKSSKEAAQESLEAHKVAIEELVAYADTEKIIRTILYYEEFIKKMRIGVNGNF